MTGQAERGVTVRLTSDHAGVDAAARLLRDGHLVAFPTETVYGLGADATNPDAVRAIYAAKGRPSFNPLIVHVADMDMARDIAVFDPQSEAMAEVHWPAPLTLVLPLKADLPPEVTAGLQTVAVRMPALPLARDLIQRVGRPLAAPSANPSGRVSPTSPEHVLAGLNGRISAILDGGATTLGLESTIVGFADGAPVLLREGAVPAEALGLEDQKVGQENARPSAPGQLSSHYAPRGRLRLNATRPEPGETMIGFGDVAGDISLSETGDMAEAAARLYAILHEMDAKGAELIAVAPIPDIGVGRAINDRLRRAAAPRTASD